MVGPGWFSCCVGDKYKATTAQFVMPSHTKGKPMPGFLGGSDLAVPVEREQGARRRLDQGVTRATRRRRALQATGNIPNTTNLLGNERQRARGPAELVRPDGEELGQRRERQHPPQHARADPHRQADRSSRPRQSASDNITSVLNG